MINKKIWLIGDDPIYMIIMKKNIAKGAGGGLLFGFGNSFGLLINVDINHNIGEKGGGGEVGFDKLFA